MKQIIKNQIFALVMGVFLPLFSKAQTITENDLSAEVDSVTTQHNDSLLVDSMAVFLPRPSVRTKEITYYSILVDKSKSDYHSAEFSEIYEEYITLRSDTPELRSLRKEFDSSKKNLEKSIKVNARKKKRRL